MLIHSHTELKVGVRMDVCALSYLLMCVAPLPGLCSLWVPLQLPDLFPLGLIGSERQETPPRAEPDPAWEKVEWAFSLCVFLSLHVFLYVCPGVCVCMCMVTYSTYLSVASLLSFSSNEGVHLHYIMPHWSSASPMKMNLLPAEVVKWTDSHCRLVLYFGICKQNPHTHKHTLAIPVGRDNPYLLYFW